MTIFDDLALHVLEFERQLVVLLALLRELLLQPTHFLFLLTQLGG